jgi:AraC-like DNA-binding protein
MPDSDPSLPMESISAETLGAAATRAGVHHRVDKPGRESDQRLMDGRMLLWRSPTGVVVHASDGRELVDSTATIQVPPRLNLVILLEGALAFSLGGQGFRLGSVGASDAAQCLAVVTTRPEMLCRPLRRGRVLRKVSVAVEGGWLARRLAGLGTDAAATSTVLSRHLASAGWSADDKTAGLAEALAGAQHPDGLHRRLHLESRALELVAVALEHLQQQCPPERSGALPPGCPDLDRLNRALDFSGRAMPRDPGLTATARYAGLSVSTLQRHFRRAYGQSFVRYVRGRRLEQAREALWRNEKTVGEAAYLAGYRHVSNFVTAYQRAFGCAPGTDSGAAALK